MIYAVDVKLYYTLDLKDVSYFYVFKLFNYLLQGGTPNAP